MSYAVALLVSPILIALAVSLGIVVLIGGAFLLWGLLNLITQSIITAVVRAVKRARARRGGDAADAERPPPRARARGRQTR